VLEILRGKEKKAQGTNNEAPAQKKERVNLFAVVQKTRQLGRGTRSLLGGGGKWATVGCYERRVLGSLQPLLRQCETRKVLYEERPEGWAFGRAI